MSVKMMRAYSTFSSTKVCYDQSQLFGLEYWGQKNQNRIYILDRFRGNTFWKEGDNLLAGKSAEHSILLVIDCLPQPAVNRIHSSTSWQPRS